MASAPGAEDPLLEVDNVTCAFRVARRRVLQAVDGVSLSIPTGETVALVGESGSGKSTLGRLLVGLQAPSAGAVRYQGCNLRELNTASYAQFRRDVQVVFQDTGSSLNPRRTIESTIELPLRHNCRLRGRLARLRVKELLDGVGLAAASFAHRYPHELSGGQRQRVAIARAVASNPRFIVADEPVSALDVSVRAQILGLMNDLRRQAGLGYLFITHDLGIVRAVADRVLVMYLGRVVEEGPVDVVLTRPSHPYTRALLAAMPVADPDRRTDETMVLEGDIPSPVNPPPGCRFHTRCPLAEDLCRSVEPPWSAFPDGLRSTCHFATHVRRMDTGPTAH